MNNNSTFAYVHTESGPVKPAKAVPIETMKNIVASIQGKHVRGEKGVNWGDLAKKVNKDCNPHGYTTIQTILNKALTEAVAQSVGQSLFRLDLGNVVCDSAHAKFKMSRKNHSVVVDMLYPNDNGNITIKYNVDDALSAVYRTAFYGNPIVQEIVDSGPNDDFCYVVFAPEIIQFFDDNLGDPHGNTTTLASTIADEIFDETDGVFFTEGPKK